MSGPNSRNAGRTGPTTNSATGTPLRGRLGGRAGTLALLLGGALLVRALRARTRWRRVLQGLLGLGLLAVGVRQRLSPAGESDGGRRAASDEWNGDGGSTGTGTDTATRTAHAVEDTTNPRDVTQEPDVETRTDPDEGPVQFTTDDESEPRSEPRLDEASEGERDTRQPAEDDGVEEVDISETAMADEPNEAVGPQPDQAEPASTEGTEPEPTPTEDASHVQADEPETDVQGEDETDAQDDDEETDDESGA